MATPRLRLYTKPISYGRMAQAALGMADAGAIAKTESLIAGYTGASHAMMTSMGRMAIYEGLRALDRRGEIILSPITVPEVISLVLLAGFTPVFCDVAPGTWNLDVDKARALITEKTAAVMTTHFFGNTNTTGAVREMCDAHGLQMIEDSAQALGAWNSGRHAGTVGDFGILSFSYPKNVTSFYGGCLITGREDIAARARAAISEYPTVDSRWLRGKVLDCAVKDMATSPPVFWLVNQLIAFGYRTGNRAIMNAVSQHLNHAIATIPAEYLTRISPAQAQAVADKWPEVDEDVRHRIACAEIYSERLKNIPGLICPELKSDRSHTYLYFPVQAEDKYALQKYMILSGCDVAAQHAQNCADLPEYSAWRRDCPAARAAYAGTVTLPTWRGFPLEQARRYADVIRGYFGA
jgi:dTDP-4-amino-4,6-dideoxygalactose transaminase